MADSLPAMSGNDRARFLDQSDRRPPPCHQTQWRDNDRLYIAWPLPNRQPHFEWMLSPARPTAGCVARRSVLTGSGLREGYWTVAPQIAECHPAHRFELQCSYVLLWCQLQILTGTPGPLW